jgi:hypothetical protein
MSDATSRYFDRFFRLLQRRGIVVICAAGNCGDESKTIGSEATYVGGATREGKRMPRNGKRCDLLAPGSELLCGQPLSPHLSEMLVGCYSGSSLAAAVVSGCLVALMHRKNCSATQALAALRDTANDDGFIDLPSADRAL